MAQAGNLFALQLHARMQIDHIVDRLVRERFVGIVGPHGTQYVRNFLWRSERVQAMPYHLEERAVNVQLWRASRCHTTGVALLMSKVAP